MKNGENLSEALLLKENIFYEFIIWAPGRALRSNLFAGTPAWWQDKKDFHFNPWRSNLPNERDILILN